MPAQRPASAIAEPQHSVIPTDLKDLFLDAQNPRFGKAVGKMTDQTAILDYIVETYGIEDVLSSIAVNGYFRSEPLLGVNRPRGGVTVVEGNRRLAACLILANDPRSKNQQKRRDHYQSIHKIHGEKSIEPVPVMVFEGKRQIDELLPYLGVRHIAGQRTWDSYAKAAWVAEMVDQGMRLDDIIQMIGDENNLAQRILEGYYLVNQLIDTGYFAPTESQRRGLGSNTEYPFSWVYTALGYPAIRRFLGVPEKKDLQPKKNPLKKDRLASGELLLALMFGNKSRSPAIDDSRKIGTLAKAIADPVQRKSLASGKTVDEIEDQTKPVRDQLEQGLTEAHARLSRVYQLLGEARVVPDDAADVLGLADRVRSLGVKVYREMSQLAGQAEGEK